MRAIKKFTLGVFGATLFTLSFSIFNLCWAQATATADPMVKKWAFISAAIAVGIGSLAAGIAVAFVGSASAGAAGEKPELFGRLLIYVGLAEGIAIYGLIIAIMILSKI